MIRSDTRDKAALQYRENMAPVCCVTTFTEHKHEPATYLCGCIPTTSKNPSITPFLIIWSRSPCQGNRKFRRNCC